MNVPRTPAVLGALALTVMLLSACGGGSTATSNSAAPASATAPAPASAVAESAEVSATDSAGVSDAVFAKSLEGFGAKCGSTPAPLIGTFDAESGSCTLDFSADSLLETACASTQEGVTVEFDQAGGTCLFVADDESFSDGVEIGCALAADPNLDGTTASVNAIFDPDSSTCELTINDAYLTEQMQSTCSALPMSAEPTFDEATATCVFTLTRAYVEESLAKADITCTDGSPAGTPSEECILAYLESKATSS